tara:strand:- start:213 stop:437 length:225 start_codon:yes stop_codon:yes gene_type:complete
MKETIESCWEWLIGKEVYFNYDKDSPCYVGENVETFKIDSVEHKLGDVYFYDECKDRYGTLEYVLENLKEKKNG